jgi:hypothetical protein
MLSRQAIRKRSAPTRAPRIATTAAAASHIRRFAKPCDSSAGAVELAGSEVISNWEWASNRATLDLSQRSIFAEVVADTALSWRPIDPLQAAK